MKSFYKDTTNITMYFVVFYSMILLEEFFAALVNNLDEGFSLSLFLIRILQFWNFNILAFSGIIFTIFLSYYFRILNKKEIIILASVYGVLGEGGLFFPWFIQLIYIPVVIMIYYLISIPAINFLKEDYSVLSLFRGFRYMLVIGILFITISVFSFVEGGLRVAYPDYFPPCHMIVCLYK